MATQVSLNSGAVASAGALAIQTNGTTEAVSISTGQVATLAQNPILTSGTANGVAYLNGSKVVTTGSALTFDGSALTVSASVAGASLTSSGAYSYLAFNNSGGATKAGLILTNSSGILQSRAETLAWTNYDASSEYMRLTSTGLKTKTTISVGDATPSTSGAGITFPATQSASSNAKTLDDYEEGTFTPTCTLTTPGTSTTASAVGFYTKVGNLVTVVGRFSFTKGTGSGDLVLGGLPFTSLNTFAYQSSGALTTDSFGVAGKIYYIILALNTTDLTLFAITQAGGAAVLASASDFGAGAIALRYTFSYQTD